MAAIPSRYQPVGAQILGGMSAVQLCTDTILERPVAIKFVPGAANRRRILDEIKALLKMRSKHVVQVYDLISVGEDIGIVQEFVEGLDLYESLGPAQDLTDYYKRLWQIAAGIADIHALGVIHRDIKLNNMKTDPEGLIKIFDFGLARDVGLSASTLGFVGTPGFAAPELHSNAVRFTTAADVYAFGIVALALGVGSDALPLELFQQPPWPAPEDCFRNLLIGSGVSERHPLALDVSRKLLACLAHEPEARPEMAEVRDLLARHLLGGRHEANLVFDGKDGKLGAANPIAHLNVLNVGQIRIRYRDLDFAVEDVSGEVTINNRAVAPGFVIAGSCVISIGAAHRRANERKFVTFDVSHPEIVL